MTPVGKTCRPLEAPAARGPHLLDASVYWGPSGGVRRVLSAKHHLMGDLGWRHTVLAPGAAGRGLVDCGGWRVPASGGYRLPLGTERLQRLIVMQQPDIVEAADPFTLGWAVLGATARLDVPAVAFCHSHLPRVAARWAGGEKGEATRRGLWAATQARRYLVRHYARFDLVLAPSRSLVQQLQDWGVRHAMRQPLGVDCTTFMPMATDPHWRFRLLHRLGLPQRTRLLVYTGRFAVEKNLDVLADAVRRLGPGHLLVAVGSGPRPPRGSQVLVLPNEADSRRLARLVASSDAYVHAGDKETFGLGVLEAMACGTPVVCSADGGTGELAYGAGHTVHGLDPRVWAEAIDASLNAGVSRQRLAAQARAREHDWPQVLQQLSRRYLRLMKQRRPTLAVPDTEPADLPQHHARPRPDAASIVARR